MRTASAIQAGHALQQGGSCCCWIAPRLLSLTILAQDTAKDSTRPQKGQPSTAAKMLKACSDKRPRNVSGAS